MFEDLIARSDACSASYKPKLLELLHRLIDEEALLPLINQLASRTRTLHLVPDFQRVDVLAHESSDWVIFSWLVNFN